MVGLDDAPAAARIGGQSGVARDAVAFHPYGVANGENRRFVDFAFEMSIFSSCVIDVRSGRWPGHAGRPFVADRAIAVRLFLNTPHGKPVELSAGSKT